MYEQETYHPPKDGITLKTLAYWFAVLFVCYHIFRGIYISWINWEWFPILKLGVITACICFISGIIAGIFIVFGILWLFSNEGGGQIQIIKPKDEKSNLSKQYEEIGRMLVNGNEQGADELLDKLNKNKIKIPK
jgi:hypothetical protein